MQVLIAISKLVKKECFANTQFKSLTCSSEESASSSIGSASSSDLLLDDDDVSSSSCPSPESHDLHELSEPTASQLPIKKGLSKYYTGKARTFASLSEVKCVEDLAKKEIPEAIISVPKGYYIKENYKKRLCHFFIGIIQDFEPSSLCLDV